MGGWGVGVRIEKKGKSVKSFGEKTRWKETTYNTRSRYIKCKSVPVTGTVVPQRVGRGIALLFHDRGTRKGCVVSSTPRPYFTPGKEPVHIVQEAVWAPGPVWTGGKSRPTGIRSSDRPARSSVAIPTELPGPQQK